MSFIPITIDEYLKIHLKSNPNENGKDFRALLEAALDAFNDGIKCDCGNDI